MRRIHTVLLASMLAVSLPAFAQQPRIEQQMTAEDFTATGLNKLSAEELARLNDWLSRHGAAATVPAPAAPAVTAGADADLEARLAQAREEGRREAAGDQQGLAPATASREPVESTLPGPFNGFAQGRQYTLANGQVWRQTDGATLAGARGNDIGVRIRPGMMGVWWLKVDGYNTQAKVERVR
ncbi:hypothetical protein LDO26_04405 [Luteimonas sp. BDR2-5]|uniref:hypothetical protein n=1 Tax=Proluteimonas luteida TaxID=2878685 RepID=UPI001E45ED0F|nr:hypothetical protein [Luteimonas sp. BDR2-5]MCD9027456.1 hypothetical protein [Luteimonas sp. BDR2-5]